MAIRPGRWVFAIGLIAMACGDDDHDDHVGAAGVGVTQGDSGAGAGTGSSAGGSGTQSGTSGRAANSGNAGRTGSAGTRAGTSGGGAGTGEAGSGAGTGSEPDPTCDLECAPGERCELMPVQCFRAPCPAQPTCVAEGSAGQPCGSRGQQQCPAGQYCQYAPGANCGAADQGGHCAERTMACTRIYQPVCGCDGQTYGNACEAAAAGMSVASEGACDESAEVDCNPSRIGCDVVEPHCDEGQVPSVQGACFGPCVPIERCACAGPSDCPHDEKYTCHMSARHCGPYV
jgi:Kazal-type serine protease inhibitor domain